MSKFADTVDTVDAAPPEPTVTERVFWHATASWACTCCSHGEALASPNLATEADLRSWCARIRRQHGIRAGFKLSAWRREYRVAGGRAIAGSREDIPLDTREDTGTPAGSAVRMRALLAELRTGDHT